MVIDQVVFRRAAIAYRAAAKHTPTDTSTHYQALRVALESVAFDMQRAAAKATKKPGFWHKFHIRRAA